MMGGYSDFVAVLCANSDDADRGAPIGSGSSPWQGYGACNFRLAVEEIG